MQLSFKQLVIFTSGCFSVGVLVGYGIALKLKHSMSLNFPMQNLCQVWPYNTKTLKVNSKSANIKTISTKAQFDEILPLLKQELTQVCKSFFILNCSLT